jgi:hypothetical protein
MSIMPVNIDNFAIVTAETPETSRNSRPTFSNKRFERSLE